LSVLHYEYGKNLEAVEDVAVLNERIIEIQKKNKMLKDYVLIQDKNLNTQRILYTKELLILKEQVH
jgi:hypothetical protein